MTYTNIESVSFHVCSPYIKEISIKNDDDDLLHLKGSETLVAGETRCYKLRGRAHRLPKEFTVQITSTANKVTAVMHVIDDREKNLHLLVGANEEGRELFVWSNKTQEKNLGNDSETPDEEVTRILKGRTRISARLNGLSPCLSPLDDGRHRG